MPKGTVLAADEHRAQERALEVVRDLGPAERAERLENITVTQASLRNPQHLATFQAEMIAALAEIVEDQDRRIGEIGRTVEEQGRRISKLEKPATKTKDPAKGGKGR